MEALGNAFDVELAGLDTKSKADIRNRLITFCARPANAAAISEQIDLCKGLAKDTTTIKSLSSLMVGNISAVRWDAAADSPLSQFAKEMYSLPFGLTDVLYSPVTGIYSNGGALLEADEDEGRLFLDSLSIDLGRPSPLAKHERVHAYTKNSPNMGIDNSFVGHLESAEPLSELSKALPHYNRVRAIDEPIAYLESNYWFAYELELEMQKHGYDNNPLAQTLYKALADGLYFGGILSRELKKVLEAMVIDEENLFAVNLEIDEDAFSHFQTGAPVPMLAMTLYLKKFQATYPLYTIDPNIIAKMKRFGPNEDGKKAEKEFSDLIDKRLTRNLELVTKCSKATGRAIRHMRMMRGEPSLDMIRHIRMTLGLVRDELIEEKLIPN